VSLLGWCWGARTGVRAAARFGPAQLVLAAPGLAIAATVRAAADAAAEVPGEEVALPFATAAFSDDAAIVARIDDDPLAWRSQPRAFLAPSRAALADAIAALPTLRVPTTVLLAAEDRIIDNEGVRRLLPDARTVTLRGGHALVLESPALVADEIVRSLLG
jgi:pimeloyl-ACP methyl ester carboxylesterase